MKCRKNTESKNTNAVKTKKVRITLSSNCAVYGSKKLRLIKEQETSGLLSSLGIKTLILSKLLIPLQYIPLKV